MWVLTGRLAAATAAIVTLCAAPGARAAVEIARDGRSAHVIVIGDDANDVARHAAAELQDHLEQVTGAQLPIVTESTLAGDAPKILVGRTRLTRRLLGGLDVRTLGPDGIVLKTVANDIVLTGGRSRGVLYAVNTFLEDAVGVRWWTSTESTIPRRPTLVIDDLDVRHVPKFRYREVLNLDVMYKDRADFASRLKLNGQHNHIPPQMGGHYSLLGWCHTAFALVPPAEHFAKDPEWFAQIDGRRQAGTQLCLTNPRMQEVLIANALAWVRKNPRAGIISVSQNDCLGPCQCETCQAVVREEGSESGPWIRLCNDIAEEVNKEFPEFLVETLAYQYTRRPPKVTRPSKNVLVRLCSIEGDFSHPLTAQSNQPFADDLRGWKEIAPNLFIWNYVTNFANYLIPHPNMKPLAEDLRFFADHNVIGVFEQGDYANHLAGDFLPLRTWLVAKLLWDPTQDQRKLEDEFLAGYYGPAAPHLRKYLEIIHAPAASEQFRMGCYNTNTTFLSDAAIRKASKQFDAAAKAVAGDAELERRIRRERLAIDHVRLLRYDFLGARQRHPDAEAARAEFVEKAERWAAAARELGVRSYSEAQGFDAYVPTLSARAARFIPPEIPKTGAALRDGQADIQEQSFHLHKPEKLVTLVNDQKASNAWAARMPGSHGEWAVQYHVPKDGKLTGTGPWDCYVLVRVDTDAARGGAFSFGLHDNARNVIVAREQVTLDHVMDGEYQAYGMTVEELRPGMYFWVAPPANNKKVAAVYVDRIFIQKRRPAP